MLAASRRASIGGLLALIIAAMQPPVGSGRWRAVASVPLPQASPTEDQCFFEEDPQSSGPSYCDQYYFCSFPRSLCQLNARRGAFELTYLAECPVCQPAPIAGAQASVDLSPRTAGVSQPRVGNLAVTAASSSAGVVSVGIGGGVALGGASGAPDITPDGRYVAFDSAATDLVAGDTNGAHDVFVRDRLLGATTRVSVASDGSQATGDSVAAAITADGRYIAFLSRASNLVANDTNGLGDVFVHDRQTAVTERVSVSSAGVQPSSSFCYWGVAVGSWPAESTAQYVADALGNYVVDISDDGRFVGFVSDAANLVVSDTNDLPDVFVRDRTLGTTTRVNVSTAGGEMDSGIQPTNTPRPRLSMSADGRFVAFDILYPLETADTNNTRDVYVRDLQGGTTARISVSSTGAQATGYSGWPSMSADGRYVAFASSAGDLVPGSGGARAIFVRDRQTNATSFVPGGVRALAPSISADGARVAYASFTWGPIVNGDITWVPNDAFVHDRAEGWTRRLNWTVTPNGATFSVKLNGDGTLVAFASSSSNLVSSDGNGADDVFVTPAGVNLLANGNFSAGTSGWLFYATPTTDYVQAQVVGGVLQFYRVPPPPGTSNQAVAFQHTGAAVGADAALEAAFTIGNSSTARKRVSVLVHDQNFSDLSVCTFWLEPAAPMRRYRMRTHTTQAWSNATLSFYAASPGSDGGAYLVDDVTLMHAPGNSVLETLCIDPTTPPSPGGAASSNLLVNPDFSLGLTPWGVYGQITWQITAGVFEFFRPQGTPSGVVLQQTGAAMNAGQIIASQFRLGNTSGVRKRVTALLHDGNFSDLTACTFWLEPGSPMAWYIVRSFTTKAWTNATLSIYPATVGTDPWIRLDDGYFWRTPNLSVVGTECIEPTPPPDPQARRPAGMAATPVAPPLRPHGRFGQSTVDRNGAARAVWSVAAGGEAQSTLELTRPIDLRDGAPARLRFESWLRGRDSRAAAQASVDGVNWTTIAAAAPGEVWMQYTVDLQPFSGRLVFVRFVFLSGSEAIPPDVWLIDGIAIDRH